MVTARRRSGLTNEVFFEGGHSILADEPESAGGANEGPSPVDLLAASLASCTAITVEMYADRKDWNLGEFQVDVESGGDGIVPERFEVTLRLACDLDDAQLDRLLEIAGRCPVHQALSAGSEVAIGDHVERV
ncbi:OsmC family protein [Thermoleophilia bacterium SCSIO 60948]|nr:OsmC family protein [Thermoleophilia bacterium SCSIO 60948]